MIEVINDYHVNYWFRNKIIDCSQISEELQLHLKLEETERPIDDIMDITELEEYLRSCDNQQKQEETQINDNSMEDEENYYNIGELSTITVSKSIKQSNPIKPIKQSKSSKSSKSSKPIYNYKREKKELPKTTRIDEFSLRKRNVLLDKFSRPKLN